SVRAAGEIDLPDAVALAAGQGDRLLAVLLEALRPLVAGARVVAPQRLDVGDLEARGSHLVQHERYVRELAVWKHVAVDEFSGTQPDPAAFRIGRRDAVVHDDSVVGEQRADLPEVALQVLQADVLEHADARDLVVDPLARDLAVVLE